jgi:hypothetical protein
MSESPGSPGSTLQAWNEGGRLYIAGGTIAAIVSLVILPLAGVVAVYCGYRLYDTEQRTTLAILITALGGFGLVWWVVYLLTF